MNALQESALGQQTDQQFSSNGQAGDDSFAPIYGAFNTAAEFLDSLDGRLAAERDKLRTENLNDEIVADKILDLQVEAHSLRFTAARSGSSGARAVTAWLTNDVGEVAIDVCKLDPADVAKRTGFAQRLVAIHPAIKPVDAERKLMQLAADLAQPKLAPRHGESSAGLSAVMLLEQMPQPVRTEAQAMLEDPQLLDHIVTDVQALGVAGERDLIRTLYLAGVSRLLFKPLAIIIQSLSSSGKTFVAETTAKLFPPEAVIHATSMTAQALHYLPLGALEHRFVVAGERSRRQDDDVADATKALREMISSGKLSKLIPVKDKDTGGYVTVKIEQKGPIAFCESTTASDIFDEDKNRCLLLSADECPAQTRCVLIRMAATHSGAVVSDGEAIIQRHWALQRMLQQRTVVIPFAELLATKFSDERVEARRAFGHLLSMVKASALLHQCQRELDTDGRIIATLGDYEVARNLCSTPLARLLGGRISDAAIAFHQRLLEWVAEAFTTTDARKNDKKSRQAVIGFLDELAGIGAVQLVTEGRGPKAAVWKVTDMPHSEVKQGGFELPTVAELENDQKLEAEPEPEPEPDTDTIDASTFVPTDDDDGVVPF